MPSPFDRPGSFGPATGGEHGVGAVAGCGASAHAAFGGHEAAHAAALKASAEATAFGSHPAVGHAALAQAAMVPGNEPVSPIIQLIMRLPGAVGLTHSFFEWISHMFMPGGHDLVNLLNPSSMLHDMASHLSAMDHASGLMQVGSEHFTTIGLHGMQMPGQFSFFHSMPGSYSFDHLGTSSSIGVDHFVQNPANVGAGADFSHAQFEHAPAAAASDGALAGPSVTGSSLPNVIAGNQRLFSDNLGSGGHFNSITSNTSVPTTSTAIPSSSGATFGQEASNMPPAHAFEGTTSGAAAGGGSAPADLAGNTRAGIDSATGTYSGNNLVASDTPVYRPTSSGYYQSSDAGQAAGGGDVTPLKAKQLTFEDIRKGVVGDHAKRLIDQIAAGKHPVPEHTKSIIDHIGHQSKGASFNVNTGSSHGTVDGIGHRALPKAYSAPAHESAVAHHPHVAHHAQSAHAKQVTDAPQQQQQTAQADGSQQAQADNSNEASTDGQDQVANAGDQPATDYTVEKGDCLWNIAEKQLGDGSRWTEIYKLNSDVVGQNPDLIFSGTHLKLPGADQIADAGKYVVKPGDNLWNIAKDHLGNPNKWGDLYKANTDVIGSNPRLILPGQQLSLPGSGGPIAAATPAAGVPVASAASAPVGSAVPAAGGMGDVSQAAGVAQPTAMQPVGFEQQAVTPAAQTMPAAGTPVSMGEGIPASANGVITAVPQKEIPVGPGAAGAATLTGLEHGSSVVSSSLAPDLSFLQRRPGS